MNLSPECLIYWASGVFLSGVDTEIDTESHGELFFFDFLRSFSSDCFRFCYFVKLFSISTAEHVYQVQYARSAVLNI